MCVLAFRVRELFLLPPSSIPFKRNLLDEKRAERNRELAKERRKNGGTSRYGRGQRRKIEAKRAMEAEIRRQAQIEKQGLAPDPNAFAGVAMLPGTFSPTQWGPASSGTGEMASEPSGASSASIPARGELGSSAASAKNEPTGSFASQRSQQNDLSSPDTPSLQRSVNLASKMRKNPQSATERIIPGAEGSTGKPPAAKGKKADLTLDDMTSSSDDERPSAKAGKKKGDKKAPLQGKDKDKGKPASAASDKPKASTGKAPKSAREQALEAIAKSPSKPKVDSSPAMAARPNKPQFNDLRKKPLTLFSGGTRHLPPKLTKPAAGAGNDTRAKQTDVGKSTAKHDAGDGSGSSSDETPLSYKAVPRRTRSNEAKRVALGEKSRNAKADEKAKPSFKVDANGKKRARFVGDTSEEDAAPRSTKQLKSGAQKAKKASPIVISDSESD